MSFRIEQIDDQTAIIRMSGRADVMSSHMLRSNFELLARQQVRNLVVDFHDTRFIDSSGLSALVAGLRLMRQNGGTLLVAGPNDHVSATFRLTNFHRFFEIYPQVDAALSAIGAIA